MKKTIASSILFHNGSDIRQEPREASLGSAPIVQAFGKSIAVHKRGNGSIPLLIAGPASLFKKDGLLPEELDNIFSIYFVDLFEKTSDEFISYPQPILTDFVNELDSIRQQLNLDKIALFGHSAGGILALKYASIHADKVLLNILVGTAPIWGNYKSKLIEEYFAYNSTSERRQLYDSDQEQLKTEKFPVKSFFISRYNARRAHFYYDSSLAIWKTLWDGLNLDESLINCYFSSIADYDIRKEISKSAVPTFLGLGLWDYSCPPYMWLDDAKEQLNKMNIEYYIFENSGHYPQIEQSKFFCEKLYMYMGQCNIASINRLVL